LLASTTQDSARARLQAAVNAAAVPLTLGQRGIRHVVCAGYDDSTEQLRQVLVEEARSVSQQLLEQLAWALAPLPRELRWVLEEVLRAPAALQTVQQVATRARVDRGTFERWFTRVGLPSPRRVLAAARVLYAHWLLQDPGFTVADVAQQLGYSRAKTLQLHARTYLSSRPVRCGSRSPPPRRCSASSEIS